MQEASRKRGSALYLVLPLLMLALAVIGFWPQYYGRLVSGASLEGVALHSLVHVHSTIFLAWIGIILVQAVFVRAGQVRLHRRLGRWFAGVGYLAAIVGVISGLELSAAQVERGNSLESAATFVAAPLLDMLMFTTFLTAAIAYRNRPEVHKRLILFTGYSFAFIGLVRYLVRVPGAMDNLWVGTALLTVPILLVIGWEALTTRRVHPVLWIGLGAFVVRLLLEFLAALPWWQPFGQAIIRPFL